MVNLAREERPGMNGYDFDVGFWSGAENPLGPPSKRGMTHSLFFSCSVTSTRLVIGRRRSRSCNTCSSVDNLQRKRSFRDVLEVLVQR